MTIIKRYPNRKLYNTETKKYITLDGIADLIREEEDVQVVDHATGEDLTTLTLTQIIFEQEKKSSGFLPRSVLTGLIQSGGETITSWRNSLMSPRELWRHVDSEIERRVQALISKGELAREEGARLRNKLLGQDRAEKSWPDEDALEQMLIERGIPTRDDIEKLKAQLDELSAKLEASEN